MGRRGAAAEDLPKAANQAKLMPADAEPALDDSLDCSGSSSEVPSWEAELSPIMVLAQPVSANRLHLI